MLWSNWPSPIPHHSLPPTSRKIYFMISTEVWFTQMWISPSDTHRFMVSSLMDSRFTFTPPCPAPAMASNIYNLFISNPSPGTCSVFFQSRTTITYVTTHHTRTLHFSSIYDFWMASQHSKPTRIHNNTISKFIPRHHDDQETSAFWWDS